MPIFTFVNNLNTTLAGAVSTSATTITLASTANLPASIPAGEVLVITLNDSATRQNFEIVYATAIIGATLTVSRAQEGTAALAWLTGDFAYSPPTAGQMGGMGQLGANNTWGGNNTFTDPVAVALATQSGHAVNLSQFPSLLLANGFKKYPDPNSPSGYFIEQWGLVGVTNNTTQTFNFPIAFPTASLNITVSFGSVLVVGNTYSVGASPTSASQFTVIAVSNVGSTVFGVYWNAKGY